MATIKQRFAQPIAPSKGAAPQHTMGPFQGMNTSVPPQNLQPGETPYAENFVINAGVLESRSCVSKYSGTTAAGWPANYVPAVYMQGYSTAGTRWDLVLVAESSETGWAKYSTDNGATWTDDSSHLTFIYPVSRGPLQADTWSWTQFFEPDSDQNAVAATSNYTLPMYRVLDASSDWTHFSDIISHESTARFVESFDNRLIFFNTTDASGTQGTRVRWSMRGDPTDFTSVGAGFEDLVNMKGRGTGMEAEEDRLILFSDFEVWEGRPRRDAYAFDFDVIKKDIGCTYSDTIVRTPVGIIWLGDDFNFYRAHNGVVRAFSPDIQRFLQDNVDTTKLKAQYDSKEGLYMLFFNRSDDNGVYPHAFFMRVRDIRPDERHPERDKADWMYQNMIGSRAAPHRAKGYDVMSLAITGNYTIGPTYHLTQDWFYDEDPNAAVKDSLTQLWTSPAMRMNNDPEVFEAVTEILIDYSYEAASSSSTLHTRVYARASHDTGWLAGSDTSTEFEGTPDVYFPTWFASSNTPSFPVMKTVHAPITPQATRYCQFMIYNPGDLASNNEPEAKLRIHNFHTTIRPWSGRRPY